MNPRVFLSRVLDLVFRRRRDRRLDEELHSHLQLLTEDYRARGLSPTDAAAAARRAFGRLDHVSEDYRDQRGLPVLDALLLDVRLGVRLLWRDRGFAAVAVAVLGAGIGVNTMLFTILNAHTIRGLPIADAARVVHVSLSNSRAQPTPLTAEHLHAIRTSAQTPVAIGGFSSGMAIFSEEGSPPERLQVSYVDAHVFAVIPPIIVAGRLFQASEDAAGQALVALISERVWQMRYDRSTDVFDRPVVIDRRPTRIVGVFAAKSRLPMTSDVWVPLSAAPAPAAGGPQPGLQVVARVPSERALADVQAEVSGIVTRTGPTGAELLRALVVPINQRYFGRVTDTAWLAFLAVGVLVVLISCANVANLMIDRSFHRAREVATRNALGASRARVIRQLLIESSVLAALGGAVGLGFALAGVRVFSAAMPANVLPYWYDYTMDWRVVTSLVSVSVATVLGFGLIPAFMASRVDLVQALKTRSGVGRTARGSRWTTALMTAEIALTMIVLANVMMGLRRMDSIPPAEHQIERASILTASLSLTGDRYRTPAQRIDVMRSLVDKLGAIPGVAAVSFATSLPVDGATSRHLASAGTVSFDDEAQPSMATVGVSSGYFRALGLTMIAGRELAEASGRTHEAMVNDAFAEQFLGGGSVIGTRISLRTASSSAPEGFEIVGIAPALRQRPRGGAEPIVYLPYALEAPATVALIVRSDSETAGLLASMRAQLLALDANVPLDGARPMRQVIRDADWNGRLSNGLIRFLATLTLLLSMAGLYAVTAHAASRRAAEIGIRMAFGARPSDIVRLMWRRAIGQVLLGIGFGILATIAWGSMFSSGQAGLRYDAPGAVAAAIAVLLVVSALATLIPVRRAARIDPIATLRAE
jgi:putative ABC transport system permease protein